MLGNSGFRELITLPLNFKTIKGLSKAGYTILLECVALTPEKLASICDIPLQMATSELKTLQKYSDLKKNMDGSENSFKLLFTTPLDMLSTTTDKNNIDGVSGAYSEPFLLSMCQSVDKLLGGGFPCGRVTELCGAPGVGKTQFCLQLSLTVQLPTWCEGLNGSVIFIDTEGNFVPKRLKQMAESFIHHYESKLVPALRDKITDPDVKKNLRNYVEKYTVDKMLSNVHYIRVTDPLELSSLCNKLHEYCNHAKNVRLIVLDSIAMPFRYEYNDIPQRNKQLANIAQTLSKLAVDLNSTVIFTNQITTKVSDNSYIVPALGDSWGHMCSVRLLLEKNVGSDSRSMKVLKHPGLPSTGQAHYAINVDGIRDPVTA